MVRSINACSFVVRPSTSSGSGVAWCALRRAQGAELLTVVVDGHRVASGVGLAGQDVAALQLFRLERVVLVHVDGTGHQLRATGAADTARTREWDIRTQAQGSVQNALLPVNGRGNGCRAPVERKGDGVQARAVVNRSRAPVGAGRSVRSIGGEQLEMHLRALDTVLFQGVAHQLHQVKWTADEPFVHIRRANQVLQEDGKPFFVYPA